MPAESVERKREKEARPESVWVNWDAVNALLDELLEAADAIERHAVKPKATWVDPMRIN